MKEHIGVLQAKIRYTEDLLLLGGRRVKTARSHGRKCLITIEHEYSRSFSHSLYSSGNFRFFFVVLVLCFGLVQCRLLGNLAWVYLQQDRYAFAEELYRYVTFTVKLVCILLFNYELYTRHPFLKDPTLMQESAKI